MKSADQYIRSLNADTAQAMQKQCPVLGKRYSSCDVERFLYDLRDRVLRHMQQHGFLNDDQQDVLDSAFYAGVYQVTKRAEKPTAINQHGGSNEQ